EILPIKPWRYHPGLAGRVEDLTAPLFDVVSEKQPQSLYQNPYNSIHLTVPPSADAAANLLAQWRNNGVIVQAPLPASTVYYQTVKISGHQKLYCRTGFICHVRVYDWNEGVIPRYENTIPVAVNDREELPEKTELHSRATHGLYTDPSFTLEPYMD